MRSRSLSAAALLAALVLATGAAGADCAGCGAVTGSVRVEQASVRTDGPKHDRDVVLELRSVAGPAQPPCTDRASMDQKGLVFVPHVLAIRKGTTVKFLNSDAEQHNVYFLDDRTGETLDIGTWGPGVSVDHTFDEPGMVITLCKLHLEMAAYVVVTDGPWFTAVQLDPSGTSAEFKIEGVPPGEYELSAWHKKLKQKGGVARVTVAPGGTTEADVVITRAKFAKAAG
jgi:plastocyanin